MTIDLSNEALDLIRGGLRSLKDGGALGHTGNAYWTDGGSQRCAWGHIIHARYPDHDLEDTDVIGICRMSPAGCEVDAAYEEMHDHSIDWASSRSYACAISRLEALLLAAISADAKIEVRSA